jgi:hypothetical protein
MREKIFYTEKEVAKILEIDTLNLTPFLWNQGVVFVGEKKPFEFKKREIDNLKERIDKLYNNQIKEYSEWLRENYGGLNA